MPGIDSRVSHSHNGHRDPSLLTQRTYIAYLACQVALQLTRGAQTILSLRMPAELANTACFTAQVINTSVDASKLHSDEYRPVSAGARRALPNKYSLENTAEISPRLHPRSNDMKHGYVSIAGPFQVHYKKGASMKQQNNPKGTSMTYHKGVQRERRAITDSAPKNQALFRDSPPF